MSLIGVQLREVVQRESFLCFVARRAVEAGRGVVWGAGTSAFPSVDLIHVGGGPGGDVAMW